MPYSIDQWIPFSGPCVYCGHADSRHRLLAAIRSRHKAGDSVADLAEDYSLPQAAIEVIVDEQDGIKTGLAERRD